MCPQWTIPALKEVDCKIGSIKLDIRFIFFSCNSLATAHCFSRHKYIYSMWKGETQSETGWGWGSIHQKIHGELTTKKCLERCCLVTYDVGKHQGTSNIAFFGLSFCMYWLFDRDSLQSPSLFGGKFVPMTLCMSCVEIYLRAVQAESNQR